MHNKKAQSQIITTVLIILLVLAAIVIVWQVVNTTVASGAKSIQDVDHCFNINLEIDSLTANTESTKKDGSLSVKRTPGSGDLKRIAIVVDGTRTDVDGTDLVELGTKTFDKLDLPVDGSVEIYAIVGDSNRLCAAAEDSAIVS